MKFDEAYALGNVLKRAGLSEYGAVRMDEDAPEFTEESHSEHSIKFHTRAPKLAPDALKILGEHDVTLTYLGEKSDIRRCLWLIEP